MPVSAGILVVSGSGPMRRFLLAHPGGPFYKNKDEGAWTIPKGLAEENEDLLQTAIREFEEETGIPLPPEAIYHLLSVVRYKNRKLLHSWAVILPELDLTGFSSNTVSLEWPPRSGQQATFPEIDRIAYFDLDTACRKVHPVQLPLIRQAGELQ